MKRAKYYLGLISLLIFMVSCAVDVSSISSEQEKKTNPVDLTTDLTALNPQQNYFGWPLNGSVRNNSNYSVYCWDDGTKEDHDIYGSDGIPGGRYYYIHPYSHSNNYSNTNNLWDVDHIQDPRTGQWYKIGARQTTVNSNGSLSGYEKAVSGAGKDS